MATYTPKNKRQAVGTSYAEVYACPSATSAVVLMCQVSNVDGVYDADISVKWLDTSATTETRIAEAITVPAKASIGLLDGPLILEAGDSIQAFASAAGDLELTLSIVEIS